MALCFNHIDAIYNKLKYTGYMYSTETPNLEEEEKCLFGGPRF
jgi:hypothetical protein